MPDLIVFSTLSPIMFVLLFPFVFGGAITVPGDELRGVPAARIFVQTVVFGSTITGVSLADDLQKGLIDRFRSLPMAHSAVLVGRTAADLDRTSCHRGHGRDRADRRLADPLLFPRGRAGSSSCSFAFAMSWLMARPVLVRTPEVVNNASFIVIFPITFVANTFVPPDTFPPCCARSRSGIRCPRSCRRRGIVRQLLRCPRRVVAAEPGALLAFWGVAILLSSSRCRCARSGTPRAGEKDPPPCRSRCCSRLSGPAEPRGRAAPPARQDGRR